MNSSRRAGFTLIELLLAMCLLVGVVTLATQLLVVHQRQALVQEARMGVNGGLRTGLAFLTAEWRDAAAGPGGTDLEVLAADSLTYRAMRGTAIACGASRQEILVRTWSRYGFRDPVPGRDSLIIFVEGDSTLAADDRWVALPLTPGSSGRVCDSGPAFGLGTLIDTLVVPLSDIRLDAPLRWFEIMQVKSYRQGSQTWLGARSVSAGEVIQPVLGPLGQPGFRLQYLDSLGQAAQGPGQVWEVVAALPVSAERAVPVAGATSQLRDSVTIGMSLRNALPF